jgi:hypothetical protein
MNYQLRSLIEWAKDLKGFIELSDNDKVRFIIFEIVNDELILLDRSPTWSYRRKSRFGCCLSFINLR